MSDSDVISSLYLPIDGAKLLLPNVSVAEVIEYVRPKEKTGTPDFYLGDIMWRGTSVPLICFEEVNGAPKPPKSVMVRIAVINNVGTNTKKLPFLAVLTQGLPRLVKVSKDIIQDASASDAPAESSRIRLDGEEAIIPNLEFLESLAIQFVE